MGKILGGTDTPFQKSRQKVANSSKFHHLREMVVFIRLQGFLRRIEQVFTDIHFIDLG
jgi:hypothetical protein